MKKYVATRCLSLSVAIPGGGTTHIAFTPKTGSGSVFYTDNEKIQEGLAKHHAYGKLFKEEAIVAKPKKKNTAAKPQLAENGGKKERVMNFACNDDAKDYLADKLGVSRSQLRTKTAIEEVAKANGIAIKWGGGTNDLGNDIAENSTTTEE